MRDFTDFPSTVEPCLHVPVYVFPALHSEGKLPYRKPEDT